MLALVIPMCVMSWTYLSKVSGIRAASHAVASNMKDGQVIRASVVGQINYGVRTSGLYRGKSNLKALACLNTGRGHFGPDDPPITVVEDAADVVTLVSSLDKYDKLDDSSFLVIPRLLKDCHTFPRGATVVYAGKSNIHSSPYYYLEDIYSRRSYDLIQKLLTGARDSVWVLQPQ